MPDEKSTPESSTETSAFSEMMYLLGKPAHVQVSPAKTVREIELADAIRRLGIDRHEWGNRPCSTCAAITKSLGEPFGCDKVRLEAASNN